MKYAIIKASGRQYKVEEGKTYIFDRTGEEGKDIVFDKVLFVRNGDSVMIGEPYLTDINVSGTVQSHLKGDKLHVSRYKAKVRHRRTIGFRPSQTKVMINKISEAKTVKKKSGAKEK